MTPLRLSALLLIVLGLGLLAACAPAPASSSAPSDDSPASSTASPTVPPAAYPLTLTDDAGREITLAAEPQAIVSLAPSNTEIVCALDACDRVVAGIEEIGLIAVDSHGNFTTPFDTTLMHRAWQVDDGPVETRVWR